MKYDELLEITKERFNMVEERRTTTHDGSKFGYVMYRDMYLMLERIKKEKKTKIIYPSLRNDIMAAYMINYYRNRPKIEDVYFRVRYEYLVAFETETQR